MLRFSPLVFALAGCGQAGSDNGADMVTPATNETGIASATDPADADPLLAYQGRYPSDEVGGVAFFDQPQVRSGMVRALGQDEMVTAGKLLAMDGPETPIALVGGELVAWRCEAHDCGPHNWALMIAPDGRHARVCYHDDDDADPQTWWFEHGKRLANDGDCSIAQSGE